MRVRFLLDEDISPRMRAAILRREPQIDILRVGDEAAPPLKTLDYQILIHLEEHRRLLITLNRASMPNHVADHLSAGRHHWGVLRVRPRTSMSVLVEDVVLIWEASEAEDWVDQFDWLPL